MGGIETERLVLRRHVVGDLSECVAMWADPNVTRHIGGRPFSREEVWSKLLRYVGHWEALGYGYWVIRDRASGRFVGEAGFADFKRELEPSIEGAPEIGWALASWAHGRGLATEAVRAMVAWGDANLTARRTVCIIDPENVASIRVAAKCGYSQVQPTTYKGAPTIIFDRRR